VGAVAEGFPSADGAKERTKGMQLKTLVNPDKGFRVEAPVGLFEGV
jgi:hypothetical protein